MRDEVLEHRSYFRVYVTCRLVSEIEKTLVVGSVVVVFHLSARILEMAHLDIEAKLSSFTLNLECQLGDIVDFLELIQNPVFARLSGIHQSQRQALH